MTEQLSPPGEEPTGPASAPMEFSLSVRDFVDFVHRRGDLAGEQHFRPANRAVEGTRGHRRLQQSRGDGYQAEVPVEYTAAQDGIVLRINGRIDGLIPDAQPPLVEEIKTVDAHWNGRCDPVHLAQARAYAAILTAQHGWQSADVRLTYFDLGTSLETDFRATETAESLAGFLRETIAAWMEWLVPHAERLRSRDQSLDNLSFPLEFRAGQRALARSVYRTIRDRGRIFAEAPTGLGKTLATLFPAVKAFPRLGEGKVFYLTAKTSGRHSAETALTQLRAAGAKLCAVTLTAKAKICFGENPCDARTCPYALGYFDRIKPALRELLGCDPVDRAAIEKTAQAHRVCPFELSLDASLWADVIIGDFNYVFDPSAQLQRHFAEGPARHVVLIDEAHNLVDRSREMHSAELAVTSLTPPRGAARGKGSGKARRALVQAQNHLEEFLAGLSASESVLAPRPHHQNELALAELPREFLPPLRQAARALETFLAQQPPGTDLTGWMDVWFSLRTFLKAADVFDATCRLLTAPAARRVRIFCLDPSQRLREVLNRLRAAVFFSATLSPLAYFRDLLGGAPEDPCAAFPSPFRSSQMDLTVLGIDLTYKGRQASLPAVAEAVKDHIRSHPGNHLVFCPSLDYLAQLGPALEALGVDSFAQTSLMDEAGRSAFLDRFQTGRNETGLAVLGGIFAEGIDLPGSRLIGVTIIGLGLPRLSLERDLLQEYFERTRGQGFDYAYRFPGMQRVLQAVGRLIRTETDEGSALLIDHRFREPRSLNLLPEWWEPKFR